MTEAMPAIPTTSRDLIKAMVSPEAEANTTYRHRLIVELVQRALNGDQLDAARYITAQFGATLVDKEGNVISAPPSKVYLC